MDFSFCVLLLSFGVTSFASTCVVANGRISSFSQTEMRMCVLFPASIHLREDTRAVSEPRLLDTGVQSTRWLQVALVLGGRTEPRLSRKGASFLPSRMSEREKTWAVRGEIE